MYVFFCTFPLKPISELRDCIEPFFLPPSQGPGALHEARQDEGGGGEGGCHCQSSCRKASSRGLQLQLFENYVDLIVKGRDVTDEEEMELLKG